MWVLCSSRWKKHERKTNSRTQDEMVFLPEEEWLRRRLDELEEEGKLEDVRWKKTEKDEQEKQ